MTKQQFRGFTANVVLHMGKGRYTGTGHFTVWAVVKTDDSDIARDCNTGFIQIGYNPGGYFIVVADDGTAA